MVDTIPALVEEESVEVFEKFGVFTRAELESRAEIKYEAYAKAVNIEARAMIDIASKHIIPAVITYITSLAKSINEVRQACAVAVIDVQEELLTQSSNLLAETKNALKELEKVTEEAAKKEEGMEQACFLNVMLCLRWSICVVRSISWR